MCLTMSIDSQGNANSVPRSAGGAEFRSSSFVIEAPTILRQAINKQ